MVTLKCLACGGIYTPLLHDGTRYFHVCPPLSVVELAAAVARGDVVLPKDETIDDAILRRAFPRPNTRNENVPSTRADAHDQVIAAGAGVVGLAS